MFRALCILLFSLALPSPCFAQASLVGTYKLLSNDLRLDGVPIQPMGKSQHGYLVITRKWWCSSSPPTTASPARTPRPRWRCSTRSRHGPGLIASKATS
jgi:hypothetical protein